MGSMGSARGVNGKLLDYKSLHMVWWIDVLMNVQWRKGRWGDKAWFAICTLERHEYNAINMGVYR